ncbi:Vesicle transport v-SNARE 13 [Rhynchospora pubera]|uniref:Vesicle transport v-SNARE 13 n=1 Tax=Rhynchospora pubera TaxID=906938 RepID=A0AAV8FNH8_9POAL|nr:Vesicle transport v-SNARE 13 [Rhynchospora pubera]
MQFNPPNLHNQHQSLCHAHNSARICLMWLHGVDENMGKSKKLLAAMSKRKRTYRNKWIIERVIADRQAQVQ